MGTKLRWVDAMDASVNITAAVFAAYLKCPTKAYLTAHGEKPPDTFVADTCGSISAAYKAKVIELTGVAPIDFSQLANEPAIAAGTLFVDCETASYAFDRLASA